MPTLIDVLAFGQALSDCFAGYFFIMAPQSFLVVDEAIPTTETSLNFAMHGFECFGMTFFLWSLLIVVKRNDPTVQIVNMVYHAVWCSYLTLHSVTNGKGWRKASALSNGSWALGPAIYHGVFCLVLLCLYGQSTPSKEKKSKRS